MPRSQSIVDRITSKIAVDAGDCWRWQGQIDKDGYGRISVWIPTWRRSRASMAHRVVYEHLVGTIPAGLEIDHLCRNRGCVNPDHLEPVSHLTNMQRSPRATRARAFRRKLRPSRSLRRPITGPSDPRHGRRSTYVNHGCRCDLCRAANGARYVPVANPKPRFRVAKVDGQLLPDDPRHGTTNGYGNHGCRCLPCRGANTAAHAAYLARRRATATGGAS